LQFYFFFVASFLAVPALLINSNAGGLQANQMDVLRFSSLSVGNIGLVVGGVNSTMTPWGALSDKTITGRQASLALMIVDFVIIALFLAFGVFVKLRIRAITQEVCRSGKRKSGKC
jgi:hypothetical protein